MQEKLIIVDKDDRQIAIEEKLYAHKKALLHRAFSVIIMRKNNEKNEILLQKRSAEKYHSSKLWSNACCGHPRPEEDTKTAAERRLNEEMGFKTNLQYLGKFLYKAELDNSYSEHEIDHVFYAFIDIDTQEKITINPAEVEKIKWINICELRKQLQENPKNFTVWLPQIVQFTEIL